MKHINWEALGLAFLRTIIILLAILGTTLLANLVYDKFGASGVLIGLCVFLFIVMMKLFYDDLK